jgi:hypothetical protein
MNWRRGLLLAGIHLTLAGFVVFMYETTDAHFLKDDYRRDPPSVKNPATAQSGDTVQFDPCAMWIDYSPYENAVRFANLPALALTGWRTDCPAHWTFAGMLHARGRVRTPAQLVATREVDFGFCTLLTGQWFFVGGWVLVRRKRRWLDPGSVMTVCTVVGVLATLGRFHPTSDLVIRPIGELAVLVIAPCWLWWFGLLVWRGARLFWQSTVAHVHRLKN